MDKKKISIIGSTGSIGTQTLEVIEKLTGKFEIISLAAGTNTELLNEQIKKFHPKSVCVSSPKYKPDFDNVLYGNEGLEEICSNTENDLIVVAVTGKIGLKPTLTAIKNHIDIALANKETLVMAGDIVMSEAKKNNVAILPIDSEHSAIHQCIKNRDFVRKLIITASGGPFLHKSIEEMQNATIEGALAHPRWKMGKKITVDSATLMNKGLEVIEAHHLFDMPYEDIKVVIHPQSIIHSAVEYVDGSVVAQMGLPSMHIPIQYAITYPERCQGIKTDSFSFEDSLTFEKPDFNKYPALKLAIEAGKTGGSATVILNAANEQAVYSFLDGNIKLSDISIIVEKMLNKFPVEYNLSVDEIFDLDERVRKAVSEILVKN
ncbi:1-deoxy-D-xylulose-5-phosphate reductoisomerase [bacterium]|nr:1-deoxy-D-xylulose-5-phosphate reductoisomerase [bacterium]